MCGIYSIPSKHHCQIHLSEYDLSVIPRLMGFVEFLIWRRISYNPFRIADRLCDDSYALQWRYNERHGVSHHRRLDCLLNRLFRRRSKKSSKLHVTDLCERNSPVTGESPSQRASDAENISICWYHHGVPPMEAEWGGSGEYFVVTSNVNKLRPRQNGCHFPGDIFKRIFLNENCLVFWLKFH